MALEVVLLIQLLQIKCVKNIQFIFNGNDIKWSRNEYECNYELKHLNSDLH